MRRLTLSLTLSLLIAAMFAVPGSAAHLGDGLVAYLPFDDGAATTEDLAHAHDGTVNGATFTATGIPSLPGNVSGLSFDGDDSVSIAQDAALDVTGAYTLSAWIDADDIVDYRPVFVRGAPNANDIEVYLQKTTNDLIVAHNRTNGGTFDYVGFDLAPTDLTHLTVVYDGTNVTAYYDGVAATVSQMTTAVTAPLDTDKGWTIGQVDHADFGGDGISNFTGLIDEPRIYSSALSADQVAALADYSRFAIASIGPDGEFNEVGSQHTTTVGLTPSLSFIPVSFEITASSPNGALAAIELTGGAGTASFTYTGDTAGSDTIHACVDYQVDTCGNEGDGYDSVVKHWYEESAKISGNAGGDTALTSGKSERWGFSGFVGFVPDYTNPDTGTTVEGYGAFGSIVVNYRELGTVCTYTPTGADEATAFTLRDASVTPTVDHDETADMAGWSNSCGGTASINLLDRTNAASDLGWKRGAVWIEASLDSYDVKRPTADQWVPLNTGNVHVSNVVA